MKLTNKKRLRSDYGAARLVEPHPYPADQSPEAFVLLAEELLVLLGRRAGGLHADPGHALGYLRRCHGGAHRTVEPRDDLARGARGDEHAERGRHVETGRHRLRDRRNLGREIRAPHHAEGEHAQLSALDGASRRRVTDETELN